MRQGGLRKHVLRMSTMLGFYGDQRVKGYESRIERRGDGAPAQRLLVFFGVRAFDELVRSKCVFCEVTFCLGGWRLSSIMQSLFTLFFDVDLKDW